MQEVFQQLGGFIVKAVQLGREAAVREDLVKDLEGSQHFGSRAILDGLRQCGIAVAVAQDEDTLVSSTRGGWEPSSLIGVDGTGDGGGVFNGGADSGGPHGGWQWGWLKVWDW